VSGVACVGRKDVGPEQARRTVRAKGAHVPIVAEAPGLPVKTRDGWLRGTPATAGGRALDNLRRLLSEQLVHYPAEFAWRIGLKEVVLCDTLSFERADCNAFADVERGRLYLSFGDHVDPAYLKRTIHHEIFHQVDFAYGRRLDADPRWEVLNPPGFRYTQDAETLQANSDALRTDQELSGFLDLYATASVAEDKAEVYTFLVVDPDLVERRAASDEVIRHKVERIEAMLDRLGPYRRILLGR